MKATELRIGNWLFSNIEKQCCKIEQIILEDDEYSLFTDIDTDIPLKYFDPITITEEWLLKFGFKNDTYGNFSKKISEYAYMVIHFKDYALVQIREVITIADHMVDAPCYYIHQLQNLYFALTGEELAIK